jgi:hemolysin activation/secretion protein
MSISRLITILNLKKNLFFIAILPSFFLINSIEVFAVENPDAGSLERTLPQMQQKLPEQIKQKKIIKDETNIKNNKEPTVSAKKFRFTGNLLINSEALLEVIKPLNKNALSIEDLEKITQAIGEFYRAKGYWARAYLPEQDVQGDEIWIDVIEAKLGSIKIQTDEKNLRFSKERALSFIEQGQKNGEPIMILNLEQSTQQLDDVAGIKAASVLTRGENESETDVIVNIENTPLVKGNVRFDYYGTRSTGYNRGILGLSLDSPLKMGEQFNLQYLKTRDIDYYSLGASYPLTSTGSVISYIYTNMDYKLGYPLESAKASGDSQSNIISISKPLLKGFNSELKGTISYAHKNYFNKASSTTVSDKAIDALTFSGIFNRADNFLGGGLNVGSLSYIYGKLDLSGWADNKVTDATTAKTDGTFSKFGFNFTRIQQLTQKDSLWVTANGQYAFNNLDSAEKMYLGGPTGIRAYPAAEANGDHALIINAELRHFLFDKFQATVFYDWGKIYLNKDLWIDWNSSNTATPNQYELKGAGLGFIYNPFESYEIVGNLAHRIGKNPGADASGNESDGTRDHLKGWISLTKVF